jgi:hypothetical protein
MGITTGIVMAAAALHVGIAIALGTDATLAPRSQNQRGPPGRLAWPDQNRHPFLPNVQCAACKHVGHVAKHCDMLATAICLEWYMKHNLLATAHNVVEKDWLTRWKDWLDNPDVPPRQVMGTYVKALDITVACLDEEMDWGCWPDDDDDVLPNNPNE